MTLVNAETGEVVAEMSADEARAKTDRAKVAVEATWELIKELYVQRAWAALGYPSWDDYATREFGTARLRLPREERQEVVASLRDAGLSHRAIEAVTGVSRPTIMKDLRESQVVKSSPPAPPEAPPTPVVPAIEAEETEVPPEVEPRFKPSMNKPEPRKVQGTDGKSYSAKPRPAAPRDRKQEAVEMDRQVDVAAIVSSIEHLGTTQHTARDAAAAVPEIATHRIDDNLDAAIEWLEMFRAAWNGRNEQSHGRTGSETAGRGSTDERIAQ